MFYGGYQQSRSSFPELVGQNGYMAASYINSLGLRPVMISPFDPVSYDYQQNRVRLVVCPRSGNVIQVPNVG